MLIKKHCNLDYTLITFSLGSLLEQVRLKPAPVGERQLAYRLRSSLHVNKIT